MAEMWRSIAFQIVLPMTIVVVFYLFFNYRRRAKGDDGAKIVPGSRGLPIIGESISFFAAFKNPAGVQSFTETRFKRYGRIFFTNFIGKNWVFTSTREAAKFILSSDLSLLQFASTRASADILGRDTIFFAGADLHRKMRRLVGDPISGDNLKKNFERMEAICLEILDGWSGKTVSAMEGTSSFAFQIISHMIASLGKGPELTTLHKSFMDIIDGTSGFAIKIPGSSYSKGCKARAKLLGLLDTIIDRRRKGKEIKDDFIQSMISRDGLCQEEKLSDPEIKDNCLALLLAGHATTGAALTWAMKFLEENLDAKETLMDEYKKIQESKLGSTTNLTWEDIHHMPYTSKVILETLRMANVSQWSARVALKDIPFQDYIIKKDWILTVDHCLLHHDDTLFPNPTKFNPSRFDETLKAYSYIGFGRGIRSCLGMNLAKLEMTIFLYHLCTKYIWKSSSKDNALSANILRMMKNGYQIEVKAK